MNDGIHVCFKIKVILYAESENHIIFGLDIFGVYKYQNIGEIYFSTFFLL